MAVIILLQKGTNTIYKELNIFGVFMEFGS